MATRDRKKEPTAANSAVEPRDYLFTWKPERWPYEELHKLLKAFQSTGSVAEPWRCLAYRKVRIGDRAYLLKQGKHIGIFGRGTVVGEPQRNRKAGENPWSVRLVFNASRGDVLWAPEEPFLVDETQLLTLSVPKKQWQSQASGISLDSNAAREIDDIIFDSVRVGRGTNDPVDDVVRVARLKRLVYQATRPNQQEFRAKMLRHYGNKCAITGCSTAAAVEAAHISTRKGVDDNSTANAILLRSDIHALFDNLLITLSEEGTKIDVSPKLRDRTYEFLREAAVARPLEESPSKENIKQHRHLFFERQQKH